MKELKSIFGVAVSNASTIISGVFVAFLIPKILSVEGYGLYKTFTLYVAYLGLFSLGIVDGIYLKYGDKNYDDLERSLFRAYFKWYIIIHLFFSVFATISAFIFTTDFDSRFILIALGVNLIAVNVTGYFQSISQITQRFKEYSVRKILQSLLNIIVVIALFCLFMHRGDISYEVYVAAVVFINYSLMAWYIYTYRDIVFGTSDSLADVSIDVKQLILKGFPLLFANICSTILLNIDRQFVNVFFVTSDYAIYAFAYNMLSLVTVATSAISTVLYPMMKRKNNADNFDVYPQLSAAVLIIVYCIMVAYFPLKVFIAWFLPKYIYSLNIFRIILPGIAISSVITVIMHNYYKVMDRVTRYFRKSLIILLISILANFIAFYLFKTMTAISIASIITISIWFVYTETDLINFDKKGCWNNRFYAITMMAFFYAISYIPNPWIGMMCYVLVLVLVTFIFYKPHLGKWKSLIS